MFVFVLLSTSQGGQLRSPFIERYIVPQGKFFLLQNIVTRAVWDNWCWILKRIVRNLEGTGWIRWMDFGWGDDVTSLGFLFTGVLN